MDRGAGPEAAASSQPRPVTGNLKGPAPGFQAPPLSGASRKVAALRELLLCLRFYQHFILTHHWLRSLVEDDATSC